MAHRIVFRPAALHDLAAIYDWIADEAGPQVALAYVGRLRAVCASLADFPARGTQRDDIRPGLRTVAFERRAVVAYLIVKREVRIVRILHRGRDIESDLAAEA